MPNDDHNPDRPNRFVSRSEVRPAVEIDCSDWVKDPPKSRGRFVAVSDVRPAVIIDAADWVPATPVTLVLSLQFPDDPDAHWIPQAEGVVRRLNAAEGELEGGVGLVPDWRRSAPLDGGRVLLTLTARNPVGAAARLARLAEWAKGAIPECVGARLAA